MPVAIIGGMSNSAELQAEIHRYADLIFQESERADWEQNAIRRLFTLLEGVSLNCGDAETFEEMTKLAEELVQAMNDSSDQTRDLTESLKRANFYERSDPAKFSEALRETLECARSTLALTQAHVARLQTLRERLDDLWERTKPKA
jgi:polyhydroxyalkanoate synthesis regulator phasin